MKRSYYRLGLVGYPVEHSLSPRLHQAALHAAGLAGVYRLYEIAETQEGMLKLKEILEAVREGKIDGLNVTVPHKQNVLPALDELTREAQEVGAVNTIWSEAGKLTGDNTDGKGFVSDLRRAQAENQAIPCNERLALVLGAGGAARAVVWGLLREGWKVTVATRNLEKGEQIRQQVGKEATQVVGFDAVTETLKREKIRLILNATPVGMWPDVTASLWRREWEFPRQALVYDLVYNPVSTGLLKMAQQAGLRTASGLGMLVEQAALAFERWTGVVPLRQAMWQAVEYFKQGEAEEGMTA